jgi:flagellar P-ring protein precursor FlgI
MKKTSDPSTSRLNFSANRDLRSASWWLAAAMCLLIVAQAQAVQIQDITRLKGAESSELVGMGLVTGLNGTGDSGKFLPAMQPLAKIIHHFTGVEVNVRELANVKNVALVNLSIEIPGEGVRDGDRLDVVLSSVGDAKSLKGGRLFVIPMIGPAIDSPVYAFASGTVSIPDPDHPTTGVITHGARLTRSVMSQYQDEFGRITLVIDQAHASWTVADNVANLINGLLNPDEPRGIAKAMDQKNVVITIPDPERENPASFISGILKTYIDASQVAPGARVVINEATGTIIIGADVQISPQLVSHAGLTITMLSPPIAPTAENTQLIEKDFFAVDPQRQETAKLSDLEAAFNQLKVDARSRINIIKAMHESGYMHAELLLK